MGGGGGWRRVAAGGGGWRVAAGVELRSGWRGPAIASVSAPTVPATEVATAAMATTKASVKARSGSIVGTASRQAKATKASTAKAPRKPAVVISKSMLSRYDAVLKAFRDAHGTELGGWDAAYEALDALLNSEPPLYFTERWTDPIFGSLRQRTAT